MNTVEHYIAKVRSLDLYPDLYTVLEKSGIQVKLRENESDIELRARNFCSNDILGLSQHPDVMKSAIEAIQQLGTSNSGCGILNGRIALHDQLEQAVSRLKQVPHTLLFLNAWMAMKGFFESFCHLAVHIPGFEHQRETVVLMDLENHGCITSAVMDASGGHISGQIFSRSPQVRYVPYRHNDPASLAKQLRKHVGPGDRIIVVSDAVFSMEGDIMPLPQIIEAMRPYNHPVLLVDEAHSSGALGNGGGIFPHFGISPAALEAEGIHPVIMSTFSKFAGSAGAAISCFSCSMRGLLLAARPHAFSVSVPPATTAAALTSVELVLQHPEWTTELQKNADFMRRRLKRAGFDVCGATQVVPVLLPDGCSPKTFARQLLHQHGFWVSPVWYAAKPRLRLVANRLHSQKDIKELVAAMSATRKSLSGAVEAVE